MAKELEMLLNPYNGTNCIVTGDINEDLEKSSSNQYISKMLVQNGFTQFIKEPTTIHGSLLDHMYMNFCHEIFSEVSRSTYFSDHDLIACGIPVDYFHVRK